MTRKLCYIPMVHVKEELGELQEAETQARERVFGKAQTAAFFQGVDDYWKLAERKIRFEAGLFRSELAPKTHIFVDGLPNSREDLVQKTVDDLIAQGKIPAYRIIGELKRAGAKVHGTEDVAWLLKETAYWKNLSARQRARDPEWEKESLENRDQAIIERVNEVVPDGEIAIIFIGQLHNVVEPLSKPPHNFEVINL